MPMERFTQCFSALPDPRADNAARDLTEILFIALLATLCGAQNCCDIALFAKTKEQLLRTVLVLAHGVPSHDTFSRVFRMLDPQASKRPSASLCEPLHRRCRALLRSMARRSGAPTNAAKATCRRSW